MCADVIFKNSDTGFLLYCLQHPSLKDSFDLFLSFLYLFSDSIDTPSALLHMQALVKLANIYVASKKHANESPNHKLLENIAKYITDMLRVSA